MDTSNWVQVLTSLFLGVCALFVPRIAEGVRRRAYAPRLEVGYEHRAPFVHRTYWVNRNDPTKRVPAHFFRLLVKNAGKSAAKRCELVLENLWVFDAAGAAHRAQDFSPVSLRFDESGERFLDLNPRRRVFWNIGHISSPDHFTSVERAYCVDFPEAARSNTRFVFDQVEIPIAQPNCLSEGCMAFELVLTSDNAKTQARFYKIRWLGEWKDGHEEMLRTAVLEELGRRPHG